MMKLNIQMFASTNKTANYELPQFVGTDKPTWLGDFNSAMSAIDAGMATNASDIESMDSRVTSAESSASSASQAVTTLTGRVASVESGVSTATTTANNAQQTATSALNTANTANGKADTNTSDISSLTTRMTQAEANIENFNLTIYETIPSSAITGSGSVEVSNLKVAKNSDGSLAKIYGSVNINHAGVGSINIQTSLRPESSITFNGLCIRVVHKGATTINVNDVSATLGTNGVLTVPTTYVSATDEKNRFIFSACLLFVKDFGDTPIGE